MIAMMAMAAAAAAQLSVPVAPRALGVNWEQHPTELIDVGSPGAISFSLLVDPSGKPVQCKVLEIVETDFSDPVCRKYMDAHFQPATDSQGVAQYGVYERALTFARPSQLKPGAPPFRLQPDLLVSVRPVPGLLTQRTEIGVAVLIDKDGKIRACSAADANAPKPLVTAACAQAQQGWQATPRRLPDGIAVGYVQRLNVAFEPQS